MAVVFAAGPLARTRRAVTGVVRPSAAAGGRKGVGTSLIAARTCPLVDGAICCAASAGARRAGRPGNATPSPPRTTGPRTPRAEAAAVRALRLPSGPTALRSTVAGRVASAFRAGAQARTGPPSAGFLAYPAVAAGSERMGTRSVRRPCRSVRATGPEGLSRAALPISGFLAPDVPTCAKASPPSFAQALTGPSPTARGRPRCAGEETGEIIPRR